MPPDRAPDQDEPRNFARARLVGYAIDAGPIWVAQLLGVGRVLAALAPFYALGIGMIDRKTGRPVIIDPPDAADLALHWVPGLCVWALVQALAIDLLGASMGALCAGLSVTRADGEAATRARLFARELLRTGPTACAMIAAGVLAEVDAQEASFWVLAAGLAVAVAAAAWNGVCALRGGRSLLDFVAGTSVLRRRPSVASASPVVP
jgi:hypothetical protein